MAVNSATSSSVPLITGAIQQAAKTTGISFEYLLTTAQIESSLNPAAQAPTSSAKGLYQFIEQTWLGTIKEQGANLGYGRHAAAISRTADGRWEVSDPTIRTEIMRLRSDPTASALMAGAFARSNAAQLQSTIGRMPSEGELYIAHFLGPDGAGRLISAAATQPTSKAATMFPQAAAANPTIFNDKTGRARSVSEVYNTLTGRFDFARATAFVPIRGTLPGTSRDPIPRSDIVAAIPVDPPPPAAVTTVAKPQAVTAESLPAVAAAAQPPAADPAVAAQAYASARDERPVQDSRPLFQSMFTDILRKTADATTPSATQASADAPSLRGFKLFADSPTDSARLFNGKF